MDRVKVSESMLATKRSLPDQRPRRLVRRVVTLTVQSLAAMLLVASIYWVLSEKGMLPGSSSPADSPIPQSIAGYRLRQTVTGQSAVEQLTEMHGKDVELTNVWIGRYQGSGTVWYSEIVSEAKAAELIGRMTGKIAAGNQAFTNLRQFQYEGVTVYSVIGMGQQHFYYQAGNKMVWLAAPQGGEEPFLQDALRALR